MFVLKYSYVDLFRGRMNYICWQGFASVLYGFYRDKNGNPMTERERDSGQPPMVK